LLERENRLLAFEALGLVRLYRPKRTP